MPRATGRTLGSPDADDPPREVEGEYEQRELPTYVQHFIDGELVDGGSVVVKADETSADETESPA